jgi:UDP-N-acetylmuramate--alanine ligase
MKRVHFIGVSGIGMSAAAWISLSRGMEVSGSALEQNEQTRRLQTMGMRFNLGHRAENVPDSDLVVRSAAVPEENPEVLEARKRRITVVRYSEYLGTLMRNKSGIAIAGTHGKTTTTAMFAAVAHRAGLDPTVICGGVMKQFGSNAVSGDGDLFIAEACEYNRSFLDLPKRYGIILNIEPEHLDYYSDLDEIRQAFRLFLESTTEGGFVCVNGDDPNVRRVVDEARAVGTGMADVRIVTVGYHDHNKYRIQSEKGEDGRYVMHVKRGGAELVSVHLPVPGRFNCINAAMPAVWALEFGVEPALITDALGSFQGTLRRLEQLGYLGGSPVYSDYAHHPTEIEASLSALREMHRGREITLVFQPHQYSRTGHFFTDFVRVLADADRIILTEVYRQRDVENAHLSMGSAALFRELERKMGDRVVFVEGKDQIPNHLRATSSNREVIVFMGAGDIDAVARKFAFSAQHP